MEKKRAFGIKIFAVILTIISVLYTCIWLFNWQDLVVYTDFIGRCSSISLLLGLLISVIGGVGLFFLKKWSRTLSLIGAVFLFACLLYIMFGLINDYLIEGNFVGVRMYILYSLIYAGGSYTSPFVLFYLTRPKVKEQFK